MQLAARTTPAVWHATPVPGPIGDLVGRPVIRATFADNGGVTRDVTALHVIGGSGQLSVEDAVRAARQYMRVVPSKQLGDLAIAVVRDGAAYRLLELDQTLASFERPGDWWAATSFRALDERVVAVVDGWMRLVERES